MTIEISTKFEDVSPIKDGDFSIDILVFRSVYQPMHILVIRRVGGSAPAPEGRPNQTGTRPNHYQ